MGILSLACLPPSSGDRASPTSYLHAYKQDTCERHEGGKVRWGGRAWGDYF